MRPFEQRYNAATKRAIYDARFARGLSYKRIATLAQDGELIPGETLPIGHEYVGQLCRKEAERRAGKTESALADKPHRDAVEILRRRMIAAADAMSAEYERVATKHPEKADPERGRLIARLLREAAALPAQKADTPLAPGANANGQREGAETGGSQEACSPRTEAPVQTTPRITA
jgi:hypothetical protein